PGRRVRFRRRQRRSRRGAGGMTAAVAVTGVGVLAAAMSGPADLLAVGPPASGRGPAADPAVRPGSRGPRYKDRATRLALAAASLAMEDAAGHGAPAGQPSTPVGAVVSCNFGNLDTVCHVADTIAARGVPATSPMDLPNASSNVVASSLAIRFVLRGANLM